MSNEAITSPNSPQTASDLGSYRKCWKNIATSNALDAEIASNTITYTLYDGMIEDKLTSASVAPIK
jgi:hypothetical protein